MSAVGWEKGHGRTAVWLAKAGRRAAAASEKSWALQPLCAGSSQSRCEEWPSPECQAGKVAEVSVGPGWEARNLRMPRGDDFLSREQRDRTE